MQFLLNPWPWYVAGPLIALVMFFLLFFGKSFGLSSNLRTMCTIGGADRYAEFFRFDWKGQIWNLVFVLGAVIGGFVTAMWLTPSTAIAINPKTVVALENLGFMNPGKTYLPPEIFGVEMLFSLKGWAVLLTGGFLVGFGTRYAGGCTSGHAISGLSNLQIPSLIAVVGFFIGGLITTHWLLPIIF